MSGLFNRLKLLRTPTFFGLILCSVFSYLLFRSFLFVRETEGVVVIGTIQFLFGFIPNLYHRKTGRIFTMAGALILPGLLYEKTAIFGSLSGLFAGAIFGIFLRQYISTFHTQTVNEDDPIFRFFISTDLTNHPYHFIKTLRPESLFFSHCFFWNDFSFISTPPHSKVSVF